MNPPPIFRWLLVCLIGLSGCGPSEEVTPTPEPELKEWQLHPEVLLDRRLQIQARATEDRMWLLGNNYLLSLDTGHRLVSDVLVAPLGNQLWHRSFLSDDYFATELTANYTFSLRRNDRPDKQANVNLRELDSTVFQLNSYYNSPMAINSRGQILVGGWVNAASSPGVTGIPLFILQVAETDDSLRISLDRRTRVNEGLVNYAGSNYLNGIYAFGDTFYFSNTENRFYRLLHDQEPQLLFPFSLVHMFKKNDTLFAIGYQQDFNLGLGFLPPGEQQWQTRYFGQLDNGFMRYESVQNRIVIYRGNQLWELVPNPNYDYLTINELNNLGLDQTTIHDIEVFQGRVYICTSRGLYFQPIEDFFSFKPEP